MLAVDADHFLNYVHDPISLSNLHGWTSAIAWPLVKMGRYVDTTHAYLM